MMQCPSCRNTPLKAIRLDAGLPAHGCHACEEYQAKLLNTFVFNDTAIVSRYTHSAEGIHR